MRKVHNWRSKHCLQIQSSEYGFLDMVSPGGLNFEKLGVNCVRADGHQMFFMSMTQEDLKFFYLQIPNQKDQNRQIRRLDKWATKG